MGLKDWKKVNDGWINKKSKKKIIFEKSKEFPGEWIVNPQTFLVGEQFFKSKSEALKFAKQYMGRN